MTDVQVQSKENRINVRIQTQNVSVSQKNNAVSASITKDPSVNVSFRNPNINVEMTKEGPKGDEVQLRKTATYIQWRYEGETEWANLVAIADLRGEQGDSGTDGTDGTDGREIELQVASSYIQWRYEGGEWTNLVALSALKGDTGETGQGLITGGSTGQVLIKKSSSNYDMEWADMISLYVTNNVDTSITNFVYTGKENSSGAYLIVKTNLTTFEKGYATIKLNPLITTYADAWSNKESLTYSTYSEAF